MRANFDVLNHCAVPFLSRAAVNLCWYQYYYYYSSRIDNDKIEKTAAVDNENNALEISDDSVFADRLSVT